MRDGGPRGDSTRWATPLLASVALLLLAAPPARAGTSTFSSPPMSYFSLRASNGYEIFVQSVSQRVSLFAVQTGKGFSFASYTVRGRVSAERIEAGFGKLGRVSVRLRTKRIKRRPLGKGCTGKAPMTRFGIFTGTIRFRGEGGYTTVAARSARGQASPAIRETCPFSPFSRGSAAAASNGRRHPPELTAFVRGKRGFTAQVLSKSSGLGKIVFEASTIEQRGRIDILRVASAVGSRASYAFADNLSSATVRPPSPFEGEATFERGQRGSTSWLGTLSVSFPGRDDVRLAGPRFSARLRPYGPF
jgi:hypothetical protein